MVPGAGAGLELLPEGDGPVAAEQIMEDWQRPLMAAMVEQVAGSGGDILEIGFGRGVSAAMIQEVGVGSHTIVEASPAVVRDYFRPWAAQYPQRDIRLVEGRWQEVVGALGQYDGVFFHAVPLDEAEFVADMADSSTTYAARFFSTAAALLKQGGAFTYMSTEIDTLSRSHQRLLMEHFSSLNLSKVSPEHTRAYPGHVVGRLDGSGQSDQVGVIWEQLRRRIDKLSPEQRRLLDRRLAAAAGPESQQLVAYFVPRPGADTASLRPFLAARLPAYMVPAPLRAYRRLAADAQRQGGPGCLVQGRGPNPVSKPPSPIRCAPRGNRDRPGADLVGCFGVWPGGPGG